MGDYAWLFGLALFALPFVGHWLQKRFPEDPETDLGYYACSECSHAVGLDDSRKHCRETDSIGGWVDDSCRCQNDFHWRHQTTTADHRDW